MFDRGVEYEEIFSGKEMESVTREYTRLKGVCYLDHAGCPPYPEAIIKEAFHDLSSNLYGNPHSPSLPSKFCLDSVDQVRYRILQHFNTTASEYSVVFTSGATASLKLVAESFLFNTERKKQSLFVYLEDNHTSVLGMREVAAGKGVGCICIGEKEAAEIFSRPLPSSSTPSPATNSLFVYPLQSNFSGTKYPSQWVDKSRSGLLDSLHESCVRSQWYCMVDAATYVSTNRLDLTSVKPDFVALSFYKVFGFPTGLGALLIRNSSSPLLRKAYYGGGTVFVALSQENTFVPRAVIHERFEDGTINFLSIISLSHGFNYLERGVPLEKISRHCFELARYGFSCLRRLHHSNGSPVSIIYTDTSYDSISTQGNILNFNLLRPNGEFIGYAEVLNLANLHGIQLRTGCFCNPGACRRHLQLTSDDVKKHFQSGHVCGDDHDLVDGQPTGSVRVSFGPYSTVEDVDKLLTMIADCFVQKPLLQREPAGASIASCCAAVSVSDSDTRDLASTAAPAPHSASHSPDTSSAPDPDSTIPVTPPSLSSLRSSSSEERLRAMCYIYFWLENVGDESVVDERFFLPETRRSSSVSLSHIFLYPVKSCGRFQVENWELSSTGLRYDREWMVTTHAGVALTQKLEPKLCLIKPVVDLKQNKLILTFKGYPRFSVPLEESGKRTEAWMCSSKVCGDQVEGEDCGDSVSRWLSHVIGRDGLRLVRQRARHSTQPASLNLSNQAQYLLINKTSVEWLADQLDPNSDCKKESMLDRFRSNFVVSGLDQPFEEQWWKTVRIGKQDFEVEGPCGRCQMICIDQETGEKTKEPLTTLAAMAKGRLKFGVYLRNRELTGTSRIAVGDTVCYQREDKHLL